MSSSTKRRISVAELLRFKASQTLESHTYIRLYTEALDTHLEVKQRQAFFMIAKMLTDGTIALHKNQSRLANYYFELAEKYISHVPSDQKNHLTFIENVYGRSKSFHLFKLGKIDETINLINQCLSATIELEKKEGLEFLILDRISQYDNLSRVLFANNNTEEGFEILSDCLVFLMTRKINEKRKFHSKYLDNNNEDYHKMRSILLYNMLTSTIEGLRKISDKDEFISISTSFLAPIIDNIECMESHTEIDIKVKKWLEIVQYFYSNDILKFKKSALQFINFPTPENDKKLDILLTSYFDYC